MQGDEKSPIDARPGPRWGRSEWRVFAGLGMTIMLLGILAVLFLRGSGAPRAAVAVREATAMPTRTPSATADQGTNSADGTTASETPVQRRASPTQTASAVPTATFTPGPSDTPLPTDTPTAPPTPTATPRLPTATPTETGTPTVTSTVTPTATPTLSFAAPQLLSPDSGQYFSGAETRIELKWLSVGVLGSDEWYGLILRYRHEGNDIEIGPWIRETSFVVPSYLAGQADEPDRRYDWGVVVVKEIGLRADGTREGREISPRSEMRNFVWR